MFLNLRSELPCRGHLVGCNGIELKRHNTTITIIFILPAAAFNTHHGLKVCILINKSRFDRIEAYMASAATDLLVIRQIVGILENEASFIAGVGDQVDEIKLELISMKSFLYDAEGKGARTQGEETWVASVRDLAYDVEDVIDEFMYHMYEQKIGGRFSRWLYKTINIPKNIWYRRQIANKLQKITTMIKAIPERNQRYGFAVIEGTNTSLDMRKWVQNQADSSLFIKEEELVGIEDKKQMLLGWLMNEEHHQIVVSVVGMGGSGKTTLVAKTFTNEVVKKHFDCYAWVTVSQSYVIEDLLRSLIKEFYKTMKDANPENLNVMSYRELLEMLVNFLESKRYLIVLDDVWDVNLWEEIKFAFPDAQCGSRIMLTTRKEDIASYSFGVESHFHSIQPLKKNYAWELFSKKAFSTCHNKICPPELEPLAWDLVEKCEGLPLAIVALGGVMSSKKSLDQWSEVYNSLNWHLSNNSLLKPVKSILLLGFNDLPYRLKHCFLYCSLFPEDYLIINKKVIRLWIAEGFVEQVKGLTLEEVAAGYLMELVSRSMLQERYTSWNPACKMHDLIRELALSIGEKEKFCAVYDGSERMEETGARRLSIQTVEGEIECCKGLSQLRSFLVFVTDALSVSFSKKLASELKLLRVLDLENAPIVKIPDELMYLFNLKYLNLRGTLVKELPEAIGKLRNLQTLDIRFTNVEVLPRGISKLINLRHLLGYRSLRDFMLLKNRIGVKAPSDISKLKKLQNLSCIESEGNFITLLRGMTQLLTLGIANVIERDARDLCVALEEMKILRSLDLWVTNQEEYLRVDTLSSPPPHLRHICLAGKLEKIPVWFYSLHSLTFLHLHWSRLEEDLLPHIEGLACLESVTLVNAYVGKELSFTRGFLKLTRLSLQNFPLLEKITIEKGVMPNLQFLELQRCMGLTTLPQGFEYLTKLEGYLFETVPEQFKESIQGAVDYYQKDKR
ncbi:disease resistance protein RPM1-like isoform X2 [Rosa rugosa]|uniref:disease resistance protein RPM1-like isoform X2 n=1 Tax=Rosa rugosa TaxID=74645 RepID=UPI002B415407|nr:disease resistance protein RPM1-like isoform X2 [Rosa rugosa]